MMSSTSTSGEMRTAASYAASPSETVCTSKPSASRFVAMTVRIIGSSSAHSTRTDWRRSKVVGAVATVMALYRHFAIGFLRRRGPFPSEIEEAEHADRGPDREGTTAGQNRGRRAPPLHLRSRNRSRGAGHADE